MNLVTLLWQLQTIDQEIDEKTKRQTLVEQTLANDPAVTSAQTALAAEQKKFGELRAILRDRELEVKSLEDKAKSVEQRLYGGTVLNPKELDGLSKDLEMHKRQRGALDDKLLELMDTVEQAQARVNLQANALKQIEGKRSGDLENLTHEHETLVKRLAWLEIERAKTRSALGVDVARTYDQLKRTKAGRAVAQLKRDSCGTCGVAVPTGLINRVRTGDEVVICVGCGRMLAP